MLRFRPIGIYVKVLTVCVILSAALYFLKHDLVTYVLPFVFGLIYVLPTIVMNPQLALSDKHILTYSMLRFRTTVDFQKLTDCDYRIKIGGRSLPCMVFHLYDSDGGAMTFPANDWSNSSKLYAAISQAVTDNRLHVKDKTAKKLGIRNSN